MAKILSQKEASLQKKLLPLNIVIFIIALTVVISLFFAPFAKIDVHKFLSNKDVVEFAETTLDEKLKEAMGGTTEGGSGENAQTAGFTLDVTPVVKRAVVEVLGKVNGDISLSAFEIAKYAADKRENKIQILVDNLISGDKGIVNQLIDSLSTGIKEVFETESGKQVIEDAVVEGLVSSMGSLLTSAAGGEDSEVAQVLSEKLTDEKVGELKDTFFEIENAQSSDDVVAVVENFTSQLNEILGEEYSISDEDKQAVSDYIVDLYDKTMESIADSEEVTEFSIEAMICVAASENIDLNELNISEMLQQFLGSGEGGDTSSLNTPSVTGKALADDSQGGQSETQSKPPLTYGELFDQAGLSDEDLKELSSTINDTVLKFIGGELDTLDEQLRNEPVVGKIYPYIYFVILGVLLLFALPWLILAITAFIRIFTKNKRFSMWYVRCFGFIAGLLFVVLFVFNHFGDKIIPDISPLIKALIASCSSLTWICLLCYLILWIVSIAWAFPIKHKIRKERKACKAAQANGTYSYENYSENYGYAVSGERYKSETERGGTYPSDIEQEGKPDYSYKDED